MERGGATCGKYISSYLEKYDHDGEENCPTTTSGANRVLFFATNKVITGPKNTKVHFDSRREVQGQKNGKQ